MRGMRRRMVPAGVRDRPASSGRSEHEPRGAFEPRRPTESRESVRIAPDPGELSRPLD